MKKLKIVGGNKLFGSIEISTAKNSVLPIIGASLLVDGTTEIMSFPNFTDCDVMLDIIASFGAKITKNIQSVSINTKTISSSFATNELVQKIRGSFFCFGAILARRKRAVFAYPGGCNIGARPIDMHLKAFCDLGIKVEDRHGYIYAEVINYNGGTVYLDFPSVGVTENIMLLACTLSGTTIIKNPAKEPEIVDLQNFLISAGAEIYGAGTDEIVIKGVNKLLNSSVYKPIGDRIIAGTYMVAVACCGGLVEFKNIYLNHLQDLAEKLRFSGVSIEEKKEGSFIVKSSRKLKAIPLIQTNPYPYFPTDLQPQIAVMQSISNGDSIVIENIFESRLGYVSQLVKMGAKIKVKNNMAFITGVKKLLGAEVQAPDLRAGAGLVIAGLVASGYTTIEGVQYIDRGYENIERQLSSLGAEIARVE